MGENHLIWAKFLCQKPFVSQQEAAFQALIFRKFKEIYVTKEDTFTPNRISVNDLMMLLEMMSAYHLALVGFPLSKILGRNSTSALREGETGKGRGEKFTKPWQNKMAMAKYTSVRISVSRKTFKGS